MHSITDTYFSDCRIRLLGILYLLFNAKKLDIEHMSRCVQIFSFYKQLFFYKECNDNTCLQSYRLKPAHICRSPASTSVAYNPAQIISGSGSQHFTAWAELALTLAKISCTLSIHVIFIANHKAPFNQKETGSSCIFKFQTKQT